MKPANKQDTRHFVDTDEEGERKLKESCEGLIWSASGVLILLLFVYIVAARSRPRQICHNDREQTARAFT